MKIGAQLYTVRDSTQDLESLSHTLKRVADIGYTVVQISATCDFEPEWMDNELKKNGLMCACTHYDSNKIINSPKETADRHKIFGCEVVGIGSAPDGFKDGYQSYQKFKQDYLPAAKQLRQAGVTFGYHNHHFEFQKHDGKTIMQHMIDDFPKDIITYIVDTYWVQFAGGDPARWIEKIPDQARCVHLKDLAIVGRDQRMAVVGEGNINFDSIFVACEKSGTEYLLVEQDDCYGEDPFDCLKRSYNNLKSFGFK